MKVKTSMTYMGTANAIVELPIDSWEEVMDWYVKWDTLYLTLTNGTKIERELNSEASEILDWRRPNDGFIFGVDEQGDETGEELDAC